MFRCNGCGKKFRELTRLKNHREKNSCGITDQDRYKGEKALEEALEVDEGDESYIVDRLIDDTNQHFEGERIQQFVILTDQFPDIENI